VSVCCERVLVFESMVCSRCECVLAQTNAAGVSVCSRFECVLAQTNAAGVSMC